MLKQLLLILSLRIEMTTIRVLYKNLKVPGRTYFYHHQGMTNLLSCNWFLLH